MRDFKGKTVAVIGGGVEGLSSAKFLKNKGAQVTVLDEKEFKDIKILRYKDIKKTTGENYLKDLDKYNLIVRSPGINPSLLKEIPSDKITTQTNLFFELCPCKIIGVTGTKGKGTTSALIYEMLKKQGFDAYLGGNIGVPPFEFLDKLSPHTIVVLELSSFQLMDLGKSPADAASFAGVATKAEKAMVGKPHIAVLLMVTSEHLAPSKWQKNFHENLGEYVNAKRNILKFQTESDFAVINKDYIASRESDIQTDGNVYYVSREDECEKGCFVRGGAIWIRDGGKDQKVINTKDILIPGEHNWENVCASAMAAFLAGVSLQNIVYVLKKFKGLEHRLELVATVNGVKYYDDSIATNPESTIAAIQAFKEPKILILGGVTEGSDFKALGDIISNDASIKAIIGVGIDWQRIKAQFQMSNIRFPMIEGARDMKTIVVAASKIAIPGDIVLLSPACKSFDMFKSYKDRGEQFKNEVAHLKQNESN